MSDYAATHRPPTKSEWTSIGIHFFSWTAGIALVLAAVFLFRSSDARPWLRAGLGLGIGVALVVVAEGWIVAKFRVTADALDAAGIGILYATLYAMHARWALVPLVVAFGTMLLVTAGAVALATRRDPMFMAILGLLGGFVTAFLLSSTENYPLAVFSYLLALNIGIAWLAARKNWWLLSALSVVLTALYEWGWALQAVNVGLLPLAAAIFAVFAVVGTVPLWYGWPDDCPAGVRWSAAAAAHLPLLFAVYVAAHLNYGPQYNVLFAFLLIVDAGLLAIVWRGGPKWLHAAGGAATLVTFIMWLRVSYTHASWPWLLPWLALFIALYLVKVTPVAGLLFGVFIGVAIREPQGWSAISVAMVVMLAAVLVVTIRNGRPIAAAIALALSCITLMALQPGLWTLIALHALLFAALFAVAWMSEHHVLAILAVPFFVAMVITADAPARWAQYSAWTPLAVAVVPYLLFIAYPLALGARAKASLDPSIAAALASLVMLVIAWMTRSAVDAQDRWLIGLVPLAEGVVMAVLLWRALKFDPREPRITLLASLTLAFVNVALPMLLPAGWLAGLWAIEVAALACIFTRVRHPVLLLWATGVAGVVFFGLAFDSDLYVLWTVYVVSGLAMFAAAYRIRLEAPVLQRIFSVAGLFELWFLINIVIANCFHSANGALNFDFATSQPAENVWYTVAWAVIATGLLILGFLIRWPSARGAAVALLVAAVLKASLFDVPHLGGVYLAASLFGLGASLVVAGVTLQTFMTGRSAGAPPAGEAGVNREVDGPCASKR